MCSNAHGPNKFIEEGWIWDAQVTTPHDTDYLPGRSTSRQLIVVRYFQKVFPGRRCHDFMTNSELSAMCDSCSVRHHRCPLLCGTNAHRLRIDKRIVLIRRGGQRTPPNHHPRTGLAEALAMQLDLSTHQNIVNLPTLCPLFSRISPVGAIGLISLRNYASCRISRSLTWSSICRAPFVFEVLTILKA